MDNEKLISQAAVTIPIIHVTTCAVYLAGYSSGFGAHVGTLFSVSDIFGLSISELFWTYLSAVIVPLIMLSPQLRPDYKSAHTRAHETGNPDIIAKAIKCDRFFAKLLAWPMVVFTVFVISYTTIAIRMDQRIPYIELSQPIVFLCSFLWARYSLSLPTKRATDIIVLVCLTLSIVAFATGLSRGQGERRYPLDQFANNRPSCGEWIVLRNLGERMIAVNKNGSRSVITSDCRRALSFPRRDSFRDVNFPELAREWWRGTAHPAVSKQKGSARN